MKKILIGLLILGSISSFASEMKCSDELIAVKALHRTLKDYDVAAYWKIEGNSRLILNARNEPGLVKDYATNLNNYSQKFQSKRIEMRDNLGQAVESLEACLKLD